MRIWYQSFTDPAETRLYHERLSAFLNRIARPGTRIRVFGMTPPSRRHRATELRCAVDVVTNAIRAEREGYDAFLLGHFQDSGLWEARAAAQLPVIGLGESAMLQACSLGRKVGLITIHPVHIPYHEEQILRYGLQHRVTQVTAVDSSPNDYVAGLKDPKHARKVGRQYAERVRWLTDRQVEVVVPAGGFPSLVIGPLLQAAAKPAVFLDSLYAAVKAAETAVDLRRHDGTTTSRLLTFQLPSTLAYAALGMPVGARRKRRA